MAATCSHFLETRYIKRPYIYMGSGARGKAQTAQKIERKNLRHNRTFSKNAYYSGSKKCSDSETA